MTFLLQDKIQFREYQQNIAKVAYYNNTLVVLPTGLGKTIIGLLVIDRDLTIFPNSKALFLAPTKPLLIQHYKNFSEVSTFKIGLVDGEVNVSKRIDIYNSDLILGTPQTIRNDIKNGILDLSSFSTIVFDEAHHAIGNYPYVEIAKVFNQKSFNKHIIGLTASPASEREKILEICRNLFIHKIEVRTEDDPDVSPYVFQKEFIKIRVDLNPQILEISKKINELNSKYKEELINNNFTYLSKSRLIGKNLMIIRNNLLKEIKQGNYSAFRGIILISKILKLNHLDYILCTQTINAAYSFSQKIIDSSSRADKELSKNVEFISIHNSIKKLVENNVENDKLKKLSELLKAYSNNKVIIFAQYRDTVSSIYEFIKNIENVRASIFIGHGKKGMSQKLQKEVINKFESGEINVLISTSVSEEGISIKGADVAIFYEPVPSAIRTIQRKGRVGRFNFGKIYVLVASDTKDEGYFWVSSKREKQLKLLLKTINQELSNNVSLRQYT
ncbi:MAG: helicase-related protein [Candidatus Rehaiarchaeum fermentans]|nr:helicase-related protein [Candidatus Rehaiarchaeum fermentans]MCW1302015.1 helicase-related protein [Candidatus Rehaiarchaeum fermentans]